MSTDNINDAFTALKTDFPIFNLVNKTPFPQQIALLGGESVQVNGNADTRVASATLLQLPNTSVFRYVSPNFEDLINYGLIKQTATVSDPGDSGIATITKTDEAAAELPASQDISADPAASDEALGADGTKGTADSQDTPTTLENQSLPGVPPQVATDATLNKTLATSKTGGRK